MQMPMPTTIPAAGRLAAIALSLALAAGALPGAGPRPAFADAQTECEEPWPYRNVPLKRVIRACTKVINSGVQHRGLLAALHYKRGMAYYDAGDYRASIADADIAIRLKPDYAYAYCNRGAAHEKLGNLKQALADYEKSARIDPIKGCGDSAAQLRKRLK